MNRPGNKLPALPPSIEQVVAFARETLDPKKIVLFSARAGGTARDVSDFDLAFVLDDESRPRWARFAAEVHEEPITLYER